MRVEKIKNAILKNKNKDLMGFVGEQFGNNRSVHEIMNHLQTLKKLNDNTLMLGIARMDQIETDYDHSKFLPSLLAITGIMFGIYVKTLDLVLVFILASFLSIALLYIMKKERRMRANAVYFRSLLIQVKEAKKRSNK
ncbi:hypothetical protein GLV94_03010 [Virgibacillus halodenitrificans]|uniref:hypothetical protein n=1 Tax=Virgibacillus halodenitrificans TaxID=1482 RepID=UPI00136A9673|nr:hypothetical protein [Virgibacillus halodenitrificans]MYL44603.1 hypothetical protein [Virgibacillus halodenitrificans]